MSVPIQLILCAVLLVLTFLSAVAAFQFFQTLSLFRKTLTKIDIYLDTKPEVVVVANKTSTPLRRFKSTRRLFHRSGSPLKS